MLLLQGYTDSKHQLLETDWKVVVWMGSEDIVSDLGLQKCSRPIAGNCLVSKPIGELSYPLHSLRCEYRSHCREPCTLIWCWRRTFLVIERGRDVSDECCVYARMVLNPKYTQKSL